MTERNRPTVERRPNDREKLQRKPFEKPQLKRQAKLPEVTNAFVGSFNP